MAAFAFPLLIPCVSTKHILYQKIPFFFFNKTKCSDAKNYGPALPLGHGFRPVPMVSIQSGRRGTERDRS